MTVYEKKKADHRIVDIDFPDESVWEKWFNIYKNDPKGKPYGVNKEKPYDGTDYFGYEGGRIKPGDTVQWESINVLEIDNKGSFTKIEVVKRSKVYTIKKTIYHDFIDERIPGNVVGWVLVKTPAFSDVVELFIKTNKGLTISRISQITGLSRNTVYGICKNLVLHKWLRREDDLSYTVLDEDDFWRGLMKIYEE